MGSGAAEASSSLGTPPRTPVHPDDAILLVGGYTHADLLAHTPRDVDASHARGVHVLRVCGVTGGMTRLSTNAIGPNVAFITRSPTNPQILYATTERIDDEGEVITLRIAPEFTLREVSRVKTGGRSTCYVNFCKNKEYMMVVSYWDAKVSMLRVGPDGRPASPRSVIMQPEAKYVDDKRPTREEHWKFRQRWPHSHCCVTEPYTNLVHFVVDLGLDRVFAYRVCRVSGSLVLKGSVGLPRGKGPRHLLFHPTLRTAYLVNELDSTVSCFRVNLPASWVSSEATAAAAADAAISAPPPMEQECDTPGAALELIQCISSLPVSEQGKTTITPQGVWKAASHSSEIRMHPSGAYFVVGNRGHDSIATYAVDQRTGSIALVGITPSGGECPRNFNWTGGGAFLVVGCQNSNRMCAFRFDAATGSLTLAAALEGVASPNYVCSVPMSAVPELVTAAAPADATPTCVNDAIARVKSFEIGGIHHSHHGSASSDFDVAPASLVL